MPPVPRRPYPVDLLLCGHRYRACEMALLAAGAAVCDETGLVLPTGEEPVPGSSGCADQMIATPEGCRP